MQKTEGFALVRGVLVVAVITATAFTGACGGSGDADSGGSGSASSGSSNKASGAGGDAQAAADQRKNTAVTAAEQKLGQVKSQVATLQSEAQKVGVGDESELAGMLRELDGQLDGAERAVGQLKTAAADSWETTNSRLDEAFSAIQGRYNAANGQLTELKREQEERRQEMLAKKNEAGDLPEGLIAGLDGDTYLAYSRASVEWIKEALSDRGLYQGEINGKLDDDTMLALARFQEMNQLTVNGIPSPATRKALEAE